MELEAVIGLEIHAQMNTATKLFCACDNDSFQKEPNTNVCPICMGFPGMLPVPSRLAIDKAMRAALALGCTIAEKSKFDRKNYFYPDLPKGYQISQYDEPFSLNGEVTLEWEGPEADAKEPSETPRELRIGITRLHIEDDAGKLVHSGQGSLCDYNRSGSPLMEIVTEPDLRSPEEAEFFARNIQAILQAVDASDADMEKGMMRFDASISIREKGSTELNPRAEIKNLNSFKMLRAALEYEINRQIEDIYVKGDKLPNDITVGWRDEQGKTVLLRNKETASDYRYFPEPDIPPMTFTKDEVEQVRATLPELPHVKKKRYVEEYGLDPQVAHMLATDVFMANWFESSLNAGISAKTAANLLTTVLTGILNDKKLSERDIKSTAEDFVALETLLEKGTISHNAAKEVLEAMIETGEAPTAIVESRGLAQLSDESAIEELCRAAIDTNPEAVASFKAGKNRAIGAIVGYVMKESKGKANPKMVDEMVRKMI